MDEKLSKTNRCLTFFDTRMDEIQMSNHERLQAKAHMAQAEAIADAVAGLFGLVRRLLKTPAARPLRRPTASVG